MGKKILLSPDANKNNTYEQKTRAVTKRDFNILRSATDDLTGRVNTAEFLLTPTQILASVESEIGGNLINEASIDLKASGAVISSNNYTDGELTNYASLSVLSNNISLAVTDAKGYTDGKVTVLSNAINLKVSETTVTGNYLIGKINLSATTAEINASKINLTGYVTVSSLAGSGTTTIDGSNIKTGTISASRINFDGASGNNVDLTGKITANSGSIGAWTIGDGITALNAGKYTVIKPGGSVAFASGSPSPTNTTGSPFMVYHNGYVKMTNANITGNIYASSGSIGGVDFSAGSGQVVFNGRIRAGTVSAGILWASASYDTSYFLITQGATAYRIYISGTDVKARAL